MSGIGWRARRGATRYLPTRHSMAKLRQVSVPSLPARFIASHLRPHSRMRSRDAWGNRGGSASRGPGAAAGAGAGGGASVGAGVGSCANEAGRRGGMGVSRVCARPDAVVSAMKAKTRSARAACCASVPCGGLARVCGVAMAAVVLIGRA